jgi:hypothetical protein
LEGLLATTTPEDKPPGLEGLLATTTPEDKPPGLEGLERMTDKRLRGHVAAADTERVVIA